MNKALSNRQRLAPATSSRSPHYYVFNTVTQAKTLMAGPQGQVQVTKLDFRVYERKQPTANEACYVATFVCVVPPLAIGRRQLPAGLPPNTREVWIPQMLEADGLAHRGITAALFYEVLRQRSTNAVIVSSSNKNDCKILPAEERSTVPRGVAQSCAEDFWEKCKDLGKAFHNSDTDRWVFDP